MKYIIKKTITLIITLLVVTFLTFIAFELIPGDSALMHLGVDATEEQLEALRDELGYNDSLFIRYGRWLGKAITGDFGESTKYNAPVSELIKERFPVTIGLAVLSIIIIILVALPLGILTSRKEETRLEGVYLFFTQLGMAIPPFFLGILITLVFGLMLRWFTPGAFVTLQESMGGFFYYLLFPAVAIAVPKIAMLVKFLKSSIKRQLTLDYVRTAKSKGSSLNRVLYGHVLKNALIPVITFLAMVIADVFAGSIVVEQVFNLPGLGRLLVVAIANRDFPIVQAIVLYIAAIVLIMNFLVDVMYRIIDPRVEANG